VVISSLGAFYCALDTEETPRERASRRHGTSPSPYNGDPLVMSPADDKGGRGSCFGTMPPSPAVPDGSPSPEQPPNETDFAGRLWFANVLTRAGTLFDPDPERYNNRLYREGRYRTYPRTPGEEHLNPYLREHEEKFYQARSGHSRSQLSLDASAREPQASGSVTPISRPPAAYPGHARSDSGGSQFLEVPRALHRAPPISLLILEHMPPEPTSPEPMSPERVQQSSSLLLIGTPTPPQITISR
jgi:hypothetical protein